MLPDPSLFAMFSFRQPYLGTTCLIRSTEGSPLGPSVRKRLADFVCTKIRRVLEFLTDGQRLEADLGALGVDQFEHVALADEDTRNADRKQ